jgi:hypothetical protein
MKIRKNGDGYPGNRRDGAQHLEDRIQRRIGASHPSHPQAERDCECNREQESGAHPKQRGTDIPPQRTVLGQLPDAGDDLQRRWENNALGHDDQQPPHGDQQRPDGDGWQDFSHFG